MRTLNQYDVSRETIERLEFFESLVQKWNPSINLIAKSTVHDIWERHIVDSVQLHQFAPENPDTWLDIGSGGGFPGIIMAIMSLGRGDGTEFSFIESDQRKSTFLRTAAREIGLNIKVHADRIEKVEPVGAAVVTARALKSLNELMPFLQRHMRADGIAILPKGQSFAAEIPDAKANWRFDLNEHPSKTNKDARILIVKDIACD